MNESSEKKKKKMMMMMMMIMMMMIAYGSARKQSVFLHKTTNTKQEWIDRSIDHGHCAKLSTIRYCTSKANQVHYLLHEGTSSQLYN